jgi:hypothetical protein
MRPTAEFPARGFSKKNPVLFKATSFFDRWWIDAHDDDGGVLLARVLASFSCLIVPSSVFSHATVSSGARTHVVAGSLLLLVTGDFVVLVTWYWILKLIGNWPSWRRMHLFHPPSLVRPRIENLGIGDERGTTQLMGKN